MQNIVLYFNIILTIAVSKKFVKLPNKHLEMKFTPRKINAFLAFKLPSAFLAGVRVKTLDNTKSTVTVKHRWINQNPFKSLYFAIHCMASELSTGVLVMQQIAQSGKRISMLVTKQNAIFTKKATGRITFKCLDGNLIKDAIENTIATGEGQTLLLKSEGHDEQGDLVSFFEYQWSIKIKQNKRY